MAMSIGMGAAKAVTGIQEQNRAHRAQVDAVNRSNAMARQKYLNDITISAFNDQRKGEVFTTQLQADAAARTCLLYTSPSPRDKSSSRMPSSA